LPKRATLTLIAQNTPALLDFIAHGSNLRGWGQNVAPDQNLLFVRGFDPERRRFTYEVNQRFGSTRPRQSSVYALPYVSLGVSIDVGVPRERQLLTQQLDVGRRRPGTKSQAIAMANFGLRTIPNPMLLILRQSDSLELSRVQADSLAELSRTFTAFADSTWTPVGRFLAGLPNDYAAGIAYARYAEARARTIDVLLTLVPHVNGLLTSKQRRRLPLQVANFLDPRVLRFMR
jgi:hypothetical protein